MLGDNDVFSYFRHTISMPAVFPPWCGACCE